MPLTFFQGASLVLGGLSYLSGRKAQKRQQRQAQEQAKKDEEFAEQQLEFQKQQQTKLDRQKAKYAAMDFINPYANFGDKFGEVSEMYTDVAETMENTFEDLTVDQQAANFQKRLLDQQSANILDRLQGAAGGSGIASLAQQLANQQQLTASKISADISKQERQNRLLSAQGEARLQQQRANLQLQGAQLGLKGEQIEAMGEGMLQEAEMSRQATLLGMQYGSAIGANQALNQAQQNQLMSQNMSNQMALSNAGLNSGYANLANKLIGSDLDFNLGGGGSGSSSFGLGQGLGSNTTSGFNSVFDIDTSAFTTPITPFNPIK